MLQISTQLPSLEKDIYINSIVGTETEDMETESVDAGETAELLGDEGEGNDGEEKEGDDGEAVEETNDGWFNI